MVFSVAGTYTMIICVYVKVNFSNPIECSTARFKEGS